MIKAEDIRTGDIVRVCRNGWFPEGAVCIVTQINSVCTRVSTHPLGNGY
nr:MAG TPA: ATPase [Caudoviricetes sp.]